ncbi:MAG: polysaccharide deacetylase family protein [Bacillota bacterium]|nr:polysaccharide deacetylase family protein [Bacillota bacterium]
MWIFYRFKLKQLLFFVVIVILTLGLYRLTNYSAEQTFQDQKPFYQGSNARKSVSFTVNVDWGEEYLPQILTLFDKHQIKGTFFLTGRWAQNNPQLVLKIAKAGHEIGNHGFSHPHVNNLKLEDNIKEIEQTSEIIYDLTKKRTKFFAPPYGEYNEVVLEAARRLNHRTILWTVDTLDWQNPPPEWITSRVLSKVHNGAIILMHPTASIAKALPEIFKGLADQDYQIEPLEKLIKD